MEMFKNEENEYLMTLVESPQMGNDMVGFDDQLNYVFQEVKKHYSPILTLEGFQIYKNVENLKERAYAIWVAKPELGYPSLYYKFYQQTPGEYIITDKIKGDKNFKGLFFKFFVGLVLQTVSKTVESDEILTTMGYNFWKNLFRNTNFYFYILDIKNGKLNELKTEDEFDRYYGPEEEKKMYKYIISRIPRTYDEVVRLRA